ncbi:carboxyl transferase domain-containing protein [Nocardioides albus]|uniref:Acetyl-CoA carboxylase carboxyl transferase subunit beta n=1 Tax=Nocardioides albus TaxID=1841 RepID=A0A7W5FB87_9ACTN|nr:carboxyl transferase domain-containing protein [Nocardioides albus]MBB3092094.1 acetyl-CoA carboxylase carboxyl transferase subunit beta [Nocardioides albus]GGU45620.1 acetyl-CoA carboxylase [Nocardioides albus]
MSARTVLSAADYLSALVDDGSYESWDTAPKQPSTGAADYPAELAAAAVHSGADESVLTGSARICGQPVVVLVSEFGFLGGSIGEAAAERLVAAITRATALGLPILAAPASGGTRMQEGTPAFVRMSSIAAAVRAHKDAGLLYVVHLRHPTTGGTMASWGGLGQMTWAEPGALTGFLGPKVYRGLYHRDFPRDVQRAENLHRVGLVDRVADVEVVRWEVGLLLDLLASPLEPDEVSDMKVGARVEQGDVDAGPTADVWASVVATRRPDRPALTEFLAGAATELLPLNGTGAGERDRSVVVAFARIAGTACVVVGQDRAAQVAGAPLGPAGLRQARRGFRVARELGLPVVTVVDTPGADLSRDAEEGGLAFEIARCLEDLTTHPHPTVCVLLAEGTGGGALALVPAQHAVATSASWLAALPPEGASVISHGVTDRAADLARAQRIGAYDLRAAGVVHAVVAVSGEDLVAAYPEIVEEIRQGFSTRRTCSR